MAAAGDVVTGEGAGGAAGAAAPGAAAGDPAAEDAASLFEPHDVSITERLIGGVKMEGREWGKFRVEASVLDRVSLAGGRFGSIRLKDVRLVNCDLANLATHGLELV